MRKHRGTKRDGFTLIELLIVITIVAILAAITVAVVATSVNTDRIRGAARQMQSLKQGAMARATRAKKPIGVRLQVNPDVDTTSVSTMIFVEQLDDWQQGTILFRKDAAAMAAGDPLRYVQDVGNSAGWTDLRDRELLPDITRIKIIDADGSIKIYLVNTTQTGTGGANEGQLILITPLNFGSPGAASIIVQDGMTPMSVPIGPGADGLARYQLELGTAPLANEEELSLPNGAVIDLDNSLLPTAWRRTIPAAAMVPTGWVFVANDAMGDQIIQKLEMDLMFSPSGIISGAMGATGKIHLVLAEVQDTVENRPPEAARRDNLLVSIFTNTGNVGVYPIDKISPLGANGVPGAVGDDDGNGIVDFDSDGIADPAELGLDDDNLALRFEFADTGEVAGQ